MTILEFRNVSKLYNNEIKALENVSFSVEEGEFVTVIGSSGSGKSTLLRCINRLVETTQGSVAFDGHNVVDIKSKKELRRLRTKIGMIFQEYNLVNRLSVIENVLHGCLGQKPALSGAVGRYTEQEKEQAFKLISKLGLAEQVYKRCDELSGGQKQRVGIARALMQKPRLILCDEPISALDPSTSKIIMDHLQDINRELGITCILSLHQVDVALRYSQRIIGIAERRIIYDGSPADLSQETIHEIYQTDEGNLITDAR